MIPIKSFYSAELSGIAALSVFLVASLGKIVPLKAPYTPGPDLLLTDLAVADFVTSAGLAQDAVPNSFTDPGTGDQVLLLISPSGGWFWQVTGMTNLPQLIYGFALLSADGSAVWAVTEPLVNPVTLNAIGQGIDAGELTFRIPLGTIV